MSNVSKDSNGEAGQLTLDEEIINAINGFIDRVENDPDSHLASCNEDIKLHPNDAWSYVNRGFVYEIMRDYEKAVADYTEAIRLEPNNAEMYFHRGSAYENGGYVDSAIADLTEAGRLAPDTWGESVKETLATLKAKRASGAPNPD